MKNLLAVVGDGTATPVLEASMRVAQRFDSHIVRLHSLTTEYAVVFGGEMGFSISSEVDRTLEREGHDRRDQCPAVVPRLQVQGHGVPGRGGAAGAQRPKRFLARGGRAGRTPSSA